MGDVVKMNVKYLCIVLIVVMLLVESKYRLIGMMGDEGEGMIPLEDPRYPKSKGKLPKGNEKTVATDKLFKHYHKQWSYDVNMETVCLDCSEDDF